jgi:hypothetical protein
MNCACTFPLFAVLKPMPRLSCFARGGCVAGTTAFSSCVHAWQVHLLSLVRQSNSAQLHSLECCASTLPSWTPTTTLLLVPVYHCWLLGASISMLAVGVVLAWSLLCVLKLRWPSAGTCHVRSLQECMEVGDMDSAGSQIWWHMASLTLLEPSHTVLCRLSVERHLL